MEWTSVSGWASLGGSMLGTSRKVPKGKDMYAIARTIEDHQHRGHARDRRLERLRGHLCHDQ